MPPRGTEILSEEYYSRLSVLSSKYNKHSEWMTKPDHGGIKSPKTDFRGKLGMLGRGSSRADTQTTPRYCWGHTGGGSWGVKVPLSSDVFQASMEKSREGHRSLGIGSPVIWTSQELSVALAKLGGHFVMDEGNGGQGCGQDGPPGLSFGLSSFSVIWSHSCNWCLDRVD